MPSNNSVCTHGMQGVKWRMQPSVPYKVFPQQAAAFECAESEGGGHDLRCGHKCGHNWDRSSYTFIVLLTVGRPRWSCSLNAIVLQDLLGGAGGERRPAIHHDHI